MTKEEKMVNNLNVLWFLFRMQREQFQGSKLIKNELLTVNMHGITYRLGCTRIWRKWWKEFTLEK
jgi:hypothetical protein